MSVLEKVNPDEIYVGNLDTGDDLLEKLTEICKVKNIRLGMIEGIGVVQKAVIGYYDQTDQQYLYKNLDQPLEITCLTGNISIKDGEPMVHAHITLADEEGNCFGGHLAAGTLVFACEFIIQSFTGAELERYFDEDTKLSLWK